VLTRREHLLAHLSFSVARTNRHTCVCTSTFASLLFPLSHPVCPPQLYSPLPPPSLARPYRAILSHAPHVSTSLCTWWMREARGRELPRASMRARARDVRAYVRRFDVVRERQDEQSALLQIWCLAHVTLFCKFNGSLYKVFILK